MNDVYDPFGYGEGPLTDPMFGVAVAYDLVPATHPVYGEEVFDEDGYFNCRSARGGSYRRLARDAASSARSRSSSTLGGQSSGFRVARTVAP